MGGNTSAREVGCERSQTSGSSGCDEGRIRLSSSQNKEVWNQAHKALRAWMGVLARKVSRDKEGAAARPLERESKSKIS